MTARPLRTASAVLAALTGRYDQRIDSDTGRLQGRVYAGLVDHGILRRHWRNEGRIAEGLWRANHPDAQALTLWQARGVVEVVSLRPPQGAVHGFEAETCARLGLRLRNAPLTARAAPSARALLALLDIFDTLDPARRPVLIHCKSGADRTGLAAALWRIHVEGRPVAEAARALSLRHLHLRWSRTGVLDRVLAAYAAQQERGAIALRDWIATEYDPEGI